MQIQNFYDVYQEYQQKAATTVNTKKLVKKVIKNIRKKTETECQNSEIDITPFVGNDLLICARRRNGILTECDYKDEGRYTLNDVVNCFGSFAHACTQLKIINPANIEDKAMILKNLKDVFEIMRKIDETVYRDYGAYSYTAIDKRWGFNRLLVESGLLAPTVLYPSYPFKRPSRYRRLVWNYTYGKQFYEV